MGKYWTLSRLWCLTHKTALDNFSEVLIASINLVTFIHTHVPWWLELHWLAWNVALLWISSFHFPCIALPLPFRSSCRLAFLGLLWTGSFRASKNSCSFTLCFAIPPPSTLSDAERRQAFPQALWWSRRTWLGGRLKTTTLQTMKMGMSVPQGWLSRKVTSM